MKLKPVRKVKVPFFIKLTSGMVRSAAAILIKDSSFLGNSINSNQHFSQETATEKGGGGKFLPNRYIIRSAKILSLLSNLLQKEHIQKDNIQAMK